MKMYELQEILLSKREIKVKGNPLLKKLLYAQLLLHGFHRNSSLIDSNNKLLESSSFGLFIRPNIDVVWVINLISAFGIPYDAYELKTIEQLNYVKDLVCQKG